MGNGLSKTSAGVAFALVAAVAACAPSSSLPSTNASRHGDSLTIDRVFTEDGWMTLDSEYVPRVCSRENPDGSAESLKAQCVAARTYLARAMRDEEGLGTPDNPVPNTTHFQSYADEPTPGCLEASKATTGVVGRYDDRFIIANYVAGALVTNAGEVGSDPTRTEDYVTYNEGLNGDDVHPTDLSSTSRTDNRGCMGQNRSNWLAEQGYNYATILKYFYGADLELRGAPAPVSTAPPPTTAAPTPKGSCCAEGSAPSCSDASVSACVCGHDGYCCSDSWDATCVQEVDQLGCGSCGTTTTTSPSECCSASSSSGCSADPTVASCVCAQDPYCCQSTWDDQCASEVSEFGCGTCKDTSTTGDAQCCSSKTSPGCGGSDVESCVCKAHPSCCQAMWDRSCVAAITELGCGTCP